MPSIPGLEWTFNTQAQQYEKMRPGYVQELYDDIFSFVPLNAGSRAVEIGIGGGQATEPVLKTGCQLLAVEYGENFSALCREKFQAYPNFSVVTSRFEDYAWDGAPCDLIFSASAFHWIPEEIGYRKVFEMLRPGGVFARFANHPYRDKGREGLYQALQELYNKYMPGNREPKEYTLEEAQARSEIAEKYGFLNVLCRLYHRKRTFTAQEYPRLLGTYSDHIAIEENTRKKFFADVERVIERFGGEITIYDTIDLQLAQKP